MHNHRIPRLINILLFGTALLASCNMPSSTKPTPTINADMLITEAVMTASAQLTLSAKANPPTVVPTAPPVITILPSPSPALPLSGPTSPPAATNTSGPTSAPATSADAASFVADITVPDGTAAAPGAVFEKTWRIKNTGTTTWSSAYTLAYIDGDRMGSPDSIPLPSQVRPGETVDISVKLTAPSKAGTFQTFFRLRNANGQFFKLDGSGDLWVKINVGLAATSTPGTTTPGTPTVTVTGTITP